MRGLILTNTDCFSTITKLATTSYLVDGMIPVLKNTSCLYFFDQYQHLNVLHHLLSYLFKQCVLNSKTCRAAITYHELH